MSNEAEDPSKFAVFRREEREALDTARPLVGLKDAPDGMEERGVQERGVEDGGRSNLAMGVALTVLALLMSGVAHRMAPVEAKVALVTGGVLVLGHYVMSAMRIVRRANGLFLGLALAFFLVTLVPVGMALWQGAADYASRIRVAEVGEGGRTGQPAVSVPSGGSSAAVPNGQPPVSNAAVQTASAIASEKVAARPEMVAGKGVVSPSAEESAPAAGGAVQVPAPATAPAPTVVEEKLSVEEREARIAAMAEITAPVVKKGGVTKPSMTGLPGEDVTIGGAGSAQSVANALSQKEFNEKVLQSKMRVVQRYPALARTGSEEVKVYAEVFNELVKRNRDFFLNPDWPTELAELVGKREGWIPEEGSDRK